MAKNALQKSFYMLLAALIGGTGIFFSTDAVKPQKKLVTVKAEYVPEPAPDAESSDQQQQTPPAEQAR